MDTLLDSGRYSDLRIVCREKSWNVHRNVLSTASSVFERMIDELPADSRPGVIDLTKYDPNIVEKMLRFIYQKDYDDERGIVPARLSIIIALQEPAQPIPNGEALIINIKVLIIAEDFGLNDLMNLAMEKYTEAIYELWDTPSFEGSIVLLYNSGIDKVRSRKLLRVTANIIAGNVAMLLERKSFRDVLNLYGKLATEVLSMIMTEKGWL
ncbi:hypothetical protein VE03_04879 [Pseudogymnoascus sp. 23342-1-I1]|nr:hypothetical protein VE03_04879 [Pseudogymnoascus sp. 23342-1-I1]